MFAEGPIGLIASAWDDIGERLLDFLRNIRARFKEYHIDWSEGELYADWDGLWAPFPDSYIDDSSGGDSIQEIANGVAFAYERNDVHEYQHHAVKGYHLFLTWLSETNCITVY